MSTEVSEQPVTLVDLIDRLVPPEEPPAISMMPQTSGWLVIAGLVLLAVLYAAWRWRVRFLENAYRRRALAELASCGQDPVLIANVLRRTALAAFPRKDVASLTGDLWLSFLDRTGAGGEAFLRGAGRSVAFAPYTTDKKVDGELAEVVAAWIRTHRRDMTP